MWLLIAAYLVIGVVFILRDLSQPITNRPLYLSKRNMRLVGMIYKVLLWPLCLHPSRSRSRSHRPDTVPMEVDASEDVIDLYNQGTAASSKGRYEEAIAFFTQAIQRDPTFVPGYINRANAYSRLTSPVADLSFEDEQLEKASEDYAKAIELDPNNGQAYWNRAVSSYVRGNYRDALLDIEKAKDLGVGDVDPSLEQTVRRFVEKKL